MRSIIFIVLAIVAVVVAAPVDQPAKILRSEFHQDPERTYYNRFQTEDGFTSEQHGELKQALDEDNKPRGVVTVRGSYTYINNQGQPETISYFADEEGFHPIGDFVPKRPEARRSS